MNDFLFEDLAENSLGVRDSSGHIKTDTCLILQYHRVALLCHDPFQLAVEPCRFEKQMEYLADSFNVVSMDEVKQHLALTTPFRRRTVAVTFDGGYTDVLYTAKEVLERYEIFATVFAASAGITEGRQFWWNELENLLVADRFQGQLEVEINRRLYDWPMRNRHDRFQAFNDLYSILSDKTPSEQREIISQVTHTLDLQPDELDDHRTMNVQELRELEKGGRITVGGHTHNCVKLTALPGWQQAAEISKNKNVLEEVLGHNIEYFSYPFGNENSYTAETIDILQNYGFTLACSSSYGAVSAAAQICPYELPRVRVGNWNPFTFYRFLKGFFD